MGGIEAIDPRYRPILEQARRVLGDDDRVQSVDVGGSVASGSADRWSDLDIAIVTTAERHMLGLLTTVFLAETGRPSPTKIWNTTYTDEQLRAVAALPAARATAEDLTAFGLGVARLIVERSRPLFQHYDLTWPTELATVAATRIKDNLGIDTTDWLN